jgi:hypothetical protein
MLVQSGWSLTRDKWLTDELSRLGEKEEEERSMSCRPSIDQKIANRNPAATKTALAVVSPQLVQLRNRSTQMHQRLEANTTPTTIVKLRHGRVT